MTSLSRKRKQKNKPTFSTVDIYEGIYRNLVLDLTAPNTREREFGLAKLVNHRIQPKTSYRGGGHIIFKRFAQLEHFHKRLIMPGDPGHDELARKCFAEFDASQQFSTLIDRSMYPLFSRAREIVESVLGEFSYDTLAKSCNFAKKAALGLSRRNSYLDKRIENLNGTLEQLALFNEIRRRDVHLLRATRRHVSCVSLVKSIKMDAVPKSYKATRIIGPDTTIGGFLSKGLGRYIRTRVEANTHIDLALQQERHKVWARNSSRSGLSATIDMSKASDSFTRQHLRMLLPPEWFAVADVCSMKEYVTPYCSDPKPLASVMLMGSGHTFPLQTLLFYALAQAASDLAQIRGLVSVYGDDIIIPNRLAPIFIWAMTKSGFSVNAEKSFWSSDHLHVEKFRESCGGDFYDGHPVRPWMPECETGPVTKASYIAELHKAINGLCSRYEPVEIENTLQWLFETLEEVCIPSFVPDTETETSGIRLMLLPWAFQNMYVADFNLPYTVDGVQQYVALRPVTRNRLSDGRIYYWNWLQQNALPGSEKLSYYAARFQNEPVALWVNTHAPEEPVQKPFRREAKRGEKVRYRWVSPPKKRE